MRVVPELCLCLFVDHFCAFAVLEEANVWMFGKENFGAIRNERNMRC